MRVVSRKCGCVLSIPHSVSQSACVILLHILICLRVKHLRILPPTQLPPTLLFCNIILHLFFIWSYMQIWLSKTQATDINPIFAVISDIKLFTAVVSQTKLACSSMLATFTLPYCFFSRGLYHNT